MNKDKIEIHNLRIGGYHPRSNTISGENLEEKVERCFILFSVAYVANGFIVKACAQVATVARHEPHLKIRVAVTRICSPEGVLATFVLRVRLYLSSVVG